MAELETRAVKRNIASKDALKSLNIALLESSAQNLASTEPTLIQFMQLKADVRTLLTYYSTEILLDSSLNGIGNAASKLDRWLIDFESKYFIDGENHSFISSEKLRDLADHRYRAIQKILGGLRGLLQHDQQQVETNLPADIKACSKDLANVLHFVKTFKGLIKRCINIELSMAADAGADLLSEKDRVIQSLEKQLINKEEEIMDLKSAIIAGGSESSRIHAINRLQERIKSLDAQLVSAKQEVENAEIGMRLAVQAKGAADDQSALLQSQLKSLRASYDRDIVRLRPILEEHVHSSHADLLDIQTLRSDAALHNNRLINLQKQVTESKTALLKARLSEQQALASAAEAGMALSECREKNAKIERMQTAILASKIKFHELSRNLECKITRLEAQLETEKTMRVLDLEKISTLETQSHYFRQDISEKEGQILSMQDQLMRWKAEAASEHLATSAMRHDLNAILESGTKEFRDDYDKLSNELALEKQNGERLTKQLQTAMHRIYELQGQLLNDPGKT